MIKTTYNVIFFFPDREPVKYRNCNNLYSIVCFVTKTFGSSWTAVNVYNKQTKEFLIQFKNGQFIPPRL